jgi:hypothetical protein
MTKAQGDVVEATPPENQSLVADSLHEFFRAIEASPEPKPRTQYVELFRHMEHIQANVQLPNPYLSARFAFFLPIFQEKFACQYCNPRHKVYLTFLLLHYPFFCKFTIKVNPSDKPYQNSRAIKEITVENTSKGFA